MLTVAHITNVVDGRSNSGTARVAKELIRQLSEDSEIQQFLIHFEESSDEIYDLPNVTEILIPVTGRGFARHFRAFLKFWLKVRLANRSFRFDIAHWHSSRVLPFFFLLPSKKVIVTLHDAGQRVLSGVNTFSTRVFYWNCRIFIRKIDLILAVSNKAMNDLHVYGKFPQKKLDFVYCGTYFNKTPPIRRIGFSLETPFLLCVSRWQKHKNVENLVAGYALFAKNSKLSLPLVLVGKPVGLHDEPRNKARELGIESSVLILSDLSDPELAYLFDNATLNIFPSIHEGFGLAVLEGLARGCPALVHRYTATAEVVGDSGFTVDMTQPADIASALEEILSSDSLLDDFRQKALLRSRDFSWQTSAIKLKNIYGNLLAKN